MAAQRGIPPKRQELLIGIKLSDPKHLGFIDADNNTISPTKCYRVSRIRLLITFHIFHFPHVLLTPTVTMSSLLKSG